MAEESPQESVLTAWAPAGLGRIVVVLRQGVVIHKAVVSAKAGAVGIASGVTVGASVALGGAGTGVAVAGAARLSEIYGNQFIEKVLRDGIPGLLASPRKTLIPWEQVRSAEYRSLILGRGRMIIRTGADAYTLKFLRNTYVAGDPRAVFAHVLGDRFTDRSAG